MPTRDVTVSGPTTSQPQLRAADADRAAVAETLGTALREGRLTVEEYDERLTAAYAARTHGELAELTADLPPARPAPVAAPRPASAGCASTGGAAAGGPDLRNAWRGWITVALIVWTVYAVGSIGTGDLQYPWPVWVVGPWGAALLARTLTSRGRRARR